MCRLTRSVDNANNVCEVIRIIRDDDVSAAFGILGDVMLRWLLSDLGRKKGRFIQLHLLLV